MNDENEDERERSRGWAWAAFFVAMLTVVYPLSLGPVHSARWKGWLSEDTYNWLLEGPYRPLEELAIAGAADGEGEIIKAYNRYVRWWITN